MDCRTFLSKLAGYYGVEPPQGQTPYLVQWCNGKNERFLDYLFAEVLKSYSSSFKTFPDISVFESCNKKATEALEYAQSSTILPPPDSLRLTDGAKSEEMVQGLEDILKSLHGKNWKGET